MAEDISDMDDDLSKSTQDGISQTTREMDVSQESLLSDVSVPASQQIGSQDIAGPSEGATFTQLRKNYPTLFSLFTISPFNAQKSTYSASCNSCKRGNWTNARATRLVQHASKCLESNPELVERLETEYAIAKKDKGTISTEQKVVIAIIELVALHNLPFSIIGSAEFKAIFTLTAPRYKVPTYHALVSELVPTYASMLRSKAIERMSGLPDGSLTLELDGWTSGSGMSVLAVGVTDPYGTFTLVGLEDMSKMSHTADNIAQCAYNLATSSEIPLIKFNSLVTDEASNCRLARDKISSKFADVSRSLITYRCMAHVINLVISSASNHEQIKPILTKLSDFITLVSRRKRLCAVLLELGGHKLSAIVPTRWYTTSDAVNSTLSIKPIFAKIPQSQARELGVEEWGNMLEDAVFWADLDILKLYFNELSKKIGHVETKYARLSNSFREFLELGNWLVKNRPRKYCDIFMSAYLKHFFKLDHQVMFAAYYMDPSHHFNYMTPESKELAITYITQLLIEMGTTRDGIRNLKDQLKEYKSKVLGMKANSMVPDLHSWYADCNLGLMKSVGHRLAACHSSSANTERLFSALSLIVSPRRNRINLKSVNDLATIRLMILSRRAAKKRYPRYKFIEEANSMHRNKQARTAFDLSCSPNFGTDQTIDSEDELPADGPSLLDEGLMSATEPVEGRGTELSAVLSREFSRFTELVNYENVRKEPTLPPYTPAGTAFSPSSRANSGPRARGVVLEDGLSELWKD